jgi:hypothetical protein
LNTSKTQSIVSGSKQGSPTFSRIRAKGSIKWRKMHHTGMIYVFWKLHILKSWLLTSKTFWDYVNNGLLKQIQKDSFWVKLSFK